MDDDGVPYKVFMYWEDSSKPEVRRFSLDKVVYGKIKPLKAKLCDVYPKLKPKQFTLAWKDEDGDEILMSCDAEVKTMLLESNDAVLKLIVRVTGLRDPDDDVPKLSAPSAADVIPSIPNKTKECVHQGITCNGCRKAVSGFRYKCISCDDFDLCGRCESEGKHPEHCVVRVPVPNMSVPLIKASIKKSRRFLKSFASQAQEENKRLRRECGRHSTDSAIQGKQDSQPGRSRRWVEIFGKYMEEFTNLAGDFSRYAEQKSETAEAASKEPGTSAETDQKNALIDEEISMNPWKLSHEDLEKLQNAVKFLQESAVGVTTKALDTVFEIASNVADEITLQNQPFTISHDWEGPMRMDNQIQQADQEARLSDGRKAKQEAAMNEEVAAKPQQEALKVEQKAPMVQQEPTQEASTSGQESSTDTAKTPAQNESIMKITFGKPTVSGKGTPEEQVARDIFVKRCDISELVSAVAAAKSELSSNASSCSSDGHGSDKAEGWTVIDPCDNAIKDLFENTDDYPANMLDLNDDLQEHMICKSSIYPSLNAASAVLDIKEDEASAMAKAAQAAKIAQTKATQAAKLAQAAAAHQALRDQLAPHVEASVRQMEAMGFSNESGWLTQLLDHNDGNIATVLDLITPGIPPPK